MQPRSTLRSSAQWYKHTLFEGLTFNTSGYVTSCLVFYTSNEQNFRSYYCTYTTNHQIREILFHCYFIFQRFGFWFRTTFYGLLWACYRSHIKLTWKIKTTETKRFKCFFNHDLLKNQIGFKVCCWKIHTVPKKKRKVKVWIVHNGHFVGPLSILNLPCYKVYCCGNVLVLSCESSMECAWGHYRYSYSKILSYPTTSMKHCWKCRPTAFSVVSFRIILKGIFTSFSVSVTGPRVHCEQRPNPSW